MFRVTRVIYPGSHRRNGFPLGFGARMKMMWLSMSPDTAHFSAKFGFLFRCVQVAVRQTYY